MGPAGHRHGMSSCMHGAVPQYRTVHTCLSDVLTLGLYNVGMGFLEGSQDTLLAPIWH